MKSKIRPTSPQAKSGKESELNQLYREHLTTIQRPQRQKSAIGLLIASLIIGTLGGILGVLLFVAYGSEIPLLDHLTIFTGDYFDKPSFFSISSRTDRLTSSEAQSLSKQVAPTIVAVYEKKALSDELGAVYLPGERLGSGFVLTNDGYIVTSAQLDPSREYVVATQDNRLYEVTTLLADPASDFYYIGVAASDFSTLGLAAASEIQTYAPVLITSYAKQSNQLTYTLDEIAQNHVHPVVEEVDKYHSSDKYDDYIKLAFIENATQDGAVVYLTNGKALGLLVHHGSETYVEPFTNLRPMLNTLFAENKVVRPAMGVEYMLLDEFPSASGDTTATSEGALITQLRDGPASTAGLAEGDIITKVDGKIISSGYLLNQAVLAHQPDEVLTIDYIRDGENLEINLLLDSQPS